MEETFGTKRTQPMEMFRWYRVVIFGENFWILKPYIGSCCCISYGRLLSPFHIYFFQAYLAPKKINRQTFGFYRWKYIVCEPTTLMATVRLLREMKRHNTGGWSLICKKMSVVIVTIISPSSEPSPVTGKVYWWINRLRRIMSCS